MLTLYSPRDDKETVETLHWYADLMDSAQRILCMTFAFNLDQVFSDVLLHKNDTLRYAVFDKNLETDVENQIDQVHNTVIAAGAKLDAGDLKNFGFRKIDRLQQEPIHPRQVHAGRSVRGRPDCRYWDGEFQRAIPVRER